MKNAQKIKVLKLVVFSDLENPFALVLYARIGFEITRKQNPARFR